MHFSLILLLSWLAWAAPTGDPTETPSLSAARATEDISIDGRLDEADWAQAPSATGFRQIEPDEGAPATQRTDVRVLYGNDAIYIGAHLFDAAPGEILRTLGRRDEFNQADWFLVSIDSYFDRKTAYTFGLNAAGVQLDGITTGRLDRSWDAVWDGAAKLTADGWVVEMRIPYSMLRFSPSDQQTWGLNFQRVIPRSGETVEWSLVRQSQQESGPVAHYGTLKGLKNIRPRRNIQVTPYTLSRMTTKEGDPGKLSSDGSINAGFDAKIGITSGIILDASVKPDFGQVDADPAELNLTAFETFFPERRQFFIEGAQIYNFSYGREGSLLYTRRIGARAPIIAATKLTGRTEKGLSIGVLAASTGANFDPTRYYGVTRLRQELGRNSSIGGMFTAFEQNAPDVTRRRSLAGGLDWDIRFHDNRYQFNGQSSFSHRTQPGEGVNAETGFMVNSGVSKIQGDWTFDTSINVFDDHFNPNDLGQLRQGNFIRVNAGVGHQINHNQAFGPFRRARVNLFTWQKWSYAGRLYEGSGFFLFSNMQTRGFQSIRISGFTDYLFGGYDIFETRGLDPWARPRQGNFRVRFGTDSRRTWQLEPTGNVTFYNRAGMNYGAGLRTKWNAGSRVRLSATVNYGGDVNRTAWVANESFRRDDTGRWAIGTSTTSPDNLSDDAYTVLDQQAGLSSIFDRKTPFAGSGDAYYAPVFGRRDTRTVDFSLRSTITFSPNLSLQLYGQLFAAKGRYDDFSILRDRDTLVPVDAFPKRYDFALRSFQSNVVLRWEYRPGSTLFLVWSQSRANRLTIDPLDAGARSPFNQSSVGQLRDVFNLFPTNVFLLKLNYTFLR